MCEPPSNEERHWRHESLPVPDERPAMAVDKDAGGSEVPGGHEAPHLGYMPQHCGELRGSVAVPAE